MEAADQNNNGNARAQRTLANWLLFLLLLNLFFNRSNERSSFRKEVVPTLSKDEYKTKVDYLGSILKNMPHPTQSPRYLNGIYMGRYNHTHETAVTLSPISVVSVYNRQYNTPSHDKHEYGDISLQITDSNTTIDDVKIVKGNVALFDKVTENLMNIVMIGYYIVPLNRIQLYTSTMNSVIQIRYNQTAIEQYNQSKAEYLNLLNDYPHRSYTSSMCISELIIEVKNYSENEEYMKNTGYMNSINCDIHINFTVKGHPFSFDDLSFNSNIYAIIVIVISIIELICTVNQIQSSNTDAKNEKISFYTTAIVCSSDCYFSIIHFVIGSQFSDITTLFMIIALLKFVLFAFYDLRFMLLTWKSQIDPQVVDLRQGILSLYLKFYFFLCIGFFFWQIPIVPYLYCILFLSPFIPQIYRTAYKNYRRSILSDNYLYGLSLSRLYVVYYFGLYSGSIRVILLGHTYYYLWTFLTTFWIILQVVIIKSQSIYGPRFFIPKMFLPKVYNYHRAIPEHCYYTENGVKTVSDCVICMSPINPKEDYLITPCNHIYHSNCLQEWMEMKMDCPTCRSHLPDLE